MLVVLAIGRMLLVLALERMLAELLLLPIVENGLDVELDVDTVDPGPPPLIPIVLLYEGVVLLGLAPSSAGVNEGCQSWGDGLVLGGERALVGGGS